MVVEAGGGGEGGRLCRKYRRRNSKLGPIERERIFRFEYPGRGNNDYSRVQAD